MTPTAPPAPVRLRLVGWVALFTLLVPASAEAARITGRVDGFRNLLNPVWADARDPKQHGYSFREPVPTVRAEFGGSFPMLRRRSASLPSPPAAEGRRQRSRSAWAAAARRRSRSSSRRARCLRFQNTDPFKHRLYGVGIKTFHARRHAARGQPRMDGAGARRLRDPRRARAEPAHVGRRRAERRGDRLSVDEGRLRAHRRGAGRLQRAGVLRGQEGGPGHPGRRSRGPTWTSRERRSRSATKGPPRPPTRPRPQRKGSEGSGGREGRRDSEGRSRRSKDAALALLVRRCSASCSAGRCFCLHVASSMYNRAGCARAREGLSVRRQVVSWYLRDDARQRSAQLIQFALDPDIAKYLQKSSDSERRSRTRRANGCSPR